MGKEVLAHLCLLVCGACQIHATLRYCIPKLSARSYLELKYACTKVDAVDRHAIQCVIAEDRLDCLMLLNSGQVDFTVAEPEDLRLLLKYNESKVQVTHQLMKFAERSPQMNIEMIAIVKSDFNSSWTTKGKNLCYLGLETGSTRRYNYYYTSYFEDWLYPASCDPSMTALENRIAGLSRHFDKACVAGSWSLDKTIDAKLKEKYRNLCALCSDPDECDENDRFYGLNGALSCLTHGNGDVAWMSKSKAADHFLDLSVAGYTLLCPDGTFASLNGGSICTWIVDPRPVVIANKQVAKVVLEKVTDKGEDEAKKYFYQIVHTPYKFSYLKKLDEPKSVVDYLKASYLSSSVKQPKCRWSSAIRWCVSTDLEDKKCRYLKMASEALGLRPAFSCVRMQNRSAIVENMDTGKCDVFVIKANDAHEAQGFGLKAVIDILPNKLDNLNTIAAVVRRNSSFKSYEDLRGATACFTGYRDTAWNAFYATLKSDCSVSEPSDIHAMSTFFRESCVLGVDRSNKTFPENLYSLCNNSDANLGVEERTFKCLEAGANVAFVNVSAAIQYSKRRTVFSAAYRVLCSKAQDNNCFLTKVILGSILVHENTTKVREDDIYLMFLTLDRHFGRMHDRETPMFNMYEAFKGHPNVLFPAATMSLRRSVAGLKYGIITADNTDTYAEACEVIYARPHNRGARAEYFVGIIVCVLSFVLHM